MALLKITAYVYVEADGDPENVAASMHNGLAGALSGFPDGDVVMAEVDHISLVSDAEAEEKGLTE